MCVGFASTLASSSALRPAGPHAGCGLDREGHEEDAGADRQEDALYFQHHLCVVVVVVVGCGSYVVPASAIVVGVPLDSVAFCCCC